MKKYKFTISGQTYEVEIKDFESTTATVSVNGTPYEVELQNTEQKQKTPVLARKPVMTKPEEGQIKKSSDGSTYKIASPLPGSISKINFNVGDTVKEGDCLITMEAMKMENNVTTDKGGVIKTIKVKVGDAVLQGDTLVEIA